MGLNNLFKQAFMPPLGKFLIKSISGSLDVKVIGYENYEYLKQHGKQCIIVFWHGLQFFPVYYFRNKKIAIMVSMSRDGDAQSKILSSYGYEIVRGSSSRGAVTGLIGLKKKLEEGFDVALAIDGPRGPLHTAKEGVNYLAIKQNCYVLPITCWFSSYKKFNSWDEYILPYPMAKGILSIGRPFLPNNMKYPMMTHKYLEKILNSMTEEIKTLVNAEKAENTK